MTKEMEILLIEIARVVSKLSPQHEEVLEKALEEAEKSVGVEELRNA